MEKKPEDYFSDLAKVKPSPTGFHPITRRSKSRFPKGLVILLIGGAALFGLIKLSLSQNPRQAMASLAQKLPPKARAAVERILNNNHRQYSETVSPMQAPGRITASTSAATPKPTGKSAFVYIDGKMYKRSPNNVYSVNGRKLYYVNNQ